MQWTSWYNRSPNGRCYFTIKNKIVKMKIRYKATYLYCMTLCMKFIDG